MFPGNYLHGLVDQYSIIKLTCASGNFDPSTTLTLRLSPPAHSSTQHNDARIYASQQSSTHAELTEQVDESTISNATRVDGPKRATAGQTSPLDSRISIAGQKPTSGNPTGDATTDSRIGSSSQADDTAVPPADIAEPLPEDEARLSDSAQEMVDRRSSSRPAKVVHLPPQNVQEERLRERESGEDLRRSDAESGRSQRLNIPNEVASSPSSTVGAYSAATPGPALDSPDTSPDSESAQNEVPPPKDLQPSPEEKREKDEHDRVLAAQKEIARQEALGDVAATPDDQLRWEEREAAAREAEERAAREDGKGPEPDAKEDRAVTEAAQVVEELEGDANMRSTRRDEDAKMADQVPEEPRDGQEDHEGQQADVEMQDDGDTIAVATRGKTQQANTSSRQVSPATSRRQGMTTRVSSGVLRQKSVSEILGDSSPIVRKSSGAISPMTRRHPSDINGHPSIEPLLPADQIAQSSSRSHKTHHRTSSTLESAMDQLMSLKGAAEDPDRDYLEPLFRIQAHDSPNTRTKALPDLVKVGIKTLSTEDHFTALHERLDFRMLRRIYQLQNANKWSLRQMEKCKEPEQPVSHHDHMMAEMKWMRKDFKAERKMKTSVCAWLASRCAEWVAAGVEERRMMQVKVKAPQPKHHHAESAVPELEHAGDSAGEDDGAPPTPRAGSPVMPTLVVAPELADYVEELRKSGEISKALKSIPTIGWEPKQPRKAQPTAVSRFIEGKVLPKASGPSRKRSRYDYEDEAEVLEMQPQLKRAKEEVTPEVSDCALFHADNKPIRDRLHSNNAFRPPSEFLMPSIAFYEFRNGSQWIWEDDQKLRKLAKEYSFNWSLIADEMALPTRYKSSAERRTPWECFERWVELESLPADMRKTVYFKTWFSRLEVSQQAAEKRYQAQVASIQQQAAASGGPTHIPPRRRTIPTRVEKRRSARYLWMVEGFRKLAKKREQAAWKQAETARAAAQRKSQSDNTQVSKVKMTPQEFSKKRHERDLQLAEMQRQQRAKAIENQQRAIQLARQAQQQPQQQGMPNGGQHQQRPGGPMQPGAVQAAGSQAANANGMIPGSQQARAAIRPANGQGMPQAPMQARPGPQQHNMMARNPQYSAQQFQMANGNMPSPGGMSTQQHLAQNQAALAAYPQQQQQLQSSPSMPPPPTPQGGSQGAQQLSSGMTPAINAIKTQLRAQNPNMAQDQLEQLANQQLVKQYTNQANQARQSAMNAAAGISGQSNVAAQQFPQNQTAYQGNRQMQPNGGMYANVNGGSNAEANGSTPHMSPSTTTPQTQQQAAYKQSMQQQQYSAMRMQQLQMQSPNPAQLSPALSQASPNMTPASPSMQSYTPNMNAMVPGGMNGQTPQQQQRPTSRSNTPQMQRVGSSGS